MPQNFKTIDYLAHGNFIQKKAYQDLSELKLFKHLKKYNPILVGTIPIELNIKTSDLDIICESYNFIEFKNALIDCFAQQKGFAVHTNHDRTPPSIVGRFSYNHFDIEIFAQPKPVEEQNGYQHMIIEYELLKLIGEKGKEKIIQYKKEGLKTEPAFAKFFKIPGNAFDKLLILKGLKDQALLNKVFTYTQTES